MRPFETAVECDAEAEDDLLTRNRATTVSAAIESFQSEGDGDDGEKLIRSTFLFCKTPARQHRAHGLSTICSMGWTMR
jgi:hypothetical protein